MDTLLHYRGFVSLILTLIMWLVATTVYAGFRRETGRRIVLGVDPFAAIFLSIAGKRWDTPMVGALCWLLLSFLFGLFIPTISGLGEFIGKPIHIILALEWVLIAPVLVGIYLYLTEGLTYFSDASRDKGVTFYGTQVLLLVLTLSMQGIMIVDEVRRPWLCSPWTIETTGTTSLPLADENRCKQIPYQANSSAGDRFSVRDLFEGFVFTDTGATVERQLSWPGVGYYSLRAIGTLMAFALLTVIAVCWWQFDRRFGSKAIVDTAFPGLGPTLQVQRVGTGLALSVLIASTMILFQCLALVANSNGKIAAELLDSSWFFWAIATIVWVAFALSIIFRLHSCILDELREMQTDWRRKYLLDSSPTKDQDLARLKDRMEIEGRLDAMVEKAQTWPLPRGLAALRSITILGQLGGAAVVLVRFVMK